MVWRRWGECSFIFSFDLAGCSAVLYKDWNCETQNAQMHSHKYTHTHTKVNSKRKSKINAILMLSQRHCRHQWQWDEQKQQNHGDRQTEKGTLLTWRHMMTWWMPGGMERCTLLGLSVLGRRLRWSTQCWRFECTPPRRGWDWVWRMCNVRIHRLSYTWTHNMYAICHQARDKADDFRLIPSSRCSIFACNNTVMPLQSIVPCSLNALNSVQGYTKAQGILIPSWYHPDIILISSCSWLPICWATLEVAIGSVKLHRFAPQLPLTDCTGTGNFWHSEACISKWRSRNQAHLGARHVIFPLIMGIKWH